MFSQTVVNLANKMDVSEHTCKQIILFESREAIRRHINDKHAFPFVVDNFEFYGMQIVFNGCTIRLNSSIGTINFNIGDCQVSLDGDIIQ